MGIFKNPILARVEKMLWKIAEEEIQKKEKNGLVDSANITREIKDLYKSLVSEERPRARLALKTYSKISRSKLDESLGIALENSDPTWYSIEKADVIKTPIVLVVPFKALQDYVIREFALLLAERIEFRDMHDETRLAFAEEAGQKFFESVLNDNLRNRIKYSMNLPNEKEAAIVDIIKNDWYYLCSEEKSSRIDTVVFSIEGRDWWREELEDVNFRPQERRFTEEVLKKWGSDCDILNR